MKITPYLDGVTVIVVITAELLSMCNGKPQLHGHQHGNAPVRLVEKPTASSSRNFLQTASEDQTFLTYRLWAILTHRLGSSSVLPTLTKTAVGNRCNYRDCDLLDTTPDAKLSTIVEPVPQAELKPPELQNPLVRFPSRRQSRLQSTRTLSNRLATGVEQGSSPDGMLLATSSCKQRRFLSSLPTS